MNFRNELKSQFKLSSMLEVFPCKNLFLITLRFFITLGGGKNKDILEAMFALRYLLWCTVVIIHAAGHQQTMMRLHEWIEFLNCYTTFLHFKPDLMTTHCFQKLRKYFWWLLLQSLEILSICYGEGKKLIEINSFSLLIFSVLRTVIASFR